MRILNEKIALVTGSSRGIGAGIARLFAQEGARVVVHGRDEQALASVRADIEQAGGKAMQVAADLTHFAEIEAMRQQIERTFGPVDILVANAGAALLNLVRSKRSVRKAGELRWRATSPPPS